MKKYYVIGVSHPTCGIMAIWKNTVAHILYALHNDLIPIVDLQHFQNQYFKDNKVFKENTWEYFFEQPSHTTLEDLKEEDTVILSDNVLVPDSRYAIYDTILPNQKKDIPQTIPPLLKKYRDNLIFSNESMTFVKRNKELICPGNDVLGILCRGTDYLNLKPQNHPIQPDPEIVLQKAKELYQKFKYQKIYLATEDAKIRGIFKKEFGNLLIDNPQYLYDHTSKNYLSEIKTGRKDHAYKTAMEYLSSLYILSKCRYFIGGQTAGTIALYFMSDFFKKQDYIYIWKLGHYGHNDKHKKYKYRLHIGKFDLFSKQKKDNKRIYRILGIKITIKKYTK